MGCMQLLGKVLAVEAAQDAIIRNELYRRRDEEVMPYDITTAQFTEYVANCEIAWQMKT